MIFCFSGTGNSMYVAKKVSEAIGEKVVAISKNAMKEQISFELSPDEKLGLIFPVYWYGMPTIVEAYLKQLEIKGYCGQYSFIIATYGNSAGGAIDTPTEILKQKNIFIKGKFGVNMVDNYVVAYDMPSQEKITTILDRAELKINTIASYIKDEREIEDFKKGMFAFTSKPLYYFYKNANHTKKFYVTASCNGCGKCEKNCPCNVIQMVSGKPKWEGDCTFCLKCIHSCPRQAIQYGKGTLKRRRYINPKTIEPIT